jgi:signal transduction histidine kinase
MRVIAVSSRAEARPDGPMATTEREERLTDWLDAQGIDGGWQLAATFAQAGLDEVDLQHGWLPPPGASRERVLRVVASTLDADALSAEIGQAASHVSDLVDATKAYTQLDRATAQDVDVHDGLEATLTVLAPAIPPGVAVVREFDRTLPLIPALPAELNQVWTQLIRNALDAMAGSGTLTVRTGLHEGALRVEIEDTGPGLTDDVRARAFEPFFTTKPVGHGTGLGLDLAWRIVVNRHRGDLRVDSVPGRTTFEVLLPIEEPTDVIRVPRA